MKNLIVLAILGAAGYFAYHYFLIPWLDDFAPPESTNGFSMPPIPDECRVKGEIVVDAIHDRKTGKISDVLLDQYTLRFKTCLKNAGFSDPDIQETYEKINQRAQYKSKTATIEAAPD